MESSRIIERIYDPSLKRSLDSPLITVLTGPRQSGKTTSVNTFLAGIKEDRKIYMNLDSSFERDRVINKENYLQEKIEEALGYRLNALKERFYLFIDEAQKLPQVFELLKILYDRYSERLKLIISGSSSLDLLDRAAETLAGRVRILRVYPFSMCEASLYEGLGGFDCAEALYKGIFSGSLDREQLSGLIEEFKPRSRKKMELVDKLLNRSLFPPTMSKIDEADIPRWLIDYIDTYIEKDMRSVRDIGNMEGYRKIVSQLAARAGGLLEYSALAADAGINQLTAKKYVSIWQESLIGFLLQPLFMNISTRIKKSKKVYFFDNALIWALSGFRERKLLEASGESGHYFENLVIADFIKWGVNLQKPPSFYFWQKSLVSEIDLVLTIEGMVIPIEIKYATVWDKKYLHAIDMFKEKHSDRGIVIPFSLIIYRGEFLAPREDVFCIPVWALA